MSKIRAMLLLSCVSLFLTGNSPPLTQKSDCKVDTEAMLALAPNVFDQDDGLGWRKLGNLPECRESAAELINLYIDRNQPALARQWLVPSFRWHEAQLLAMSGEKERAIIVMRAAIKPEKGPAGLSAWTEYALPWNNYVRASIAFLEHDRDALLEAREKLAAAPRPSDYSNFDNSQPAGDPAPWPENLDVVDALIACFNKPYTEAYGSLECRAKTKP